jgi:hypothetical protein
VADDDGRSMASLQSESGVHASQMAIPPASVIGDGAQDGGQQAHKARKTKLQLWNDLKISCKSATPAAAISYSKVSSSNYTSIYFDIYPCSTHASHSHTAESVGPKKLPIKRSITSHWGDGTVNNQLGKP